MLVRAPGRVNLIGDHTDYTGGLVLPMAIDRWTTIDAEAGGDRISLSSADEPDDVDLPLLIDHPERVQPAWGRYVAGVVAEVGPAIGLRGTVHTDIPIGAGLSSSAALELAVALALGCSGTPLETALLCQRAEQRASGVPSGIMDQLAIAAGVDDHALLIDCHALTVDPVAVPEGVDVVVRFVAHRTLVGSEYADRVAECARAEAIIGPLRLASIDATTRIDDPIVAARARHVISENERVREFASALAAGDLRAAGKVMVRSHDSLRHDFGTSTSGMDAAVAELVACPGVLGARMTGGGFGGCVVALCETGAIARSHIDDCWTVRAVGGAHRV